MSQTSYALGGMAILLIVRESETFYLKSTTTNLLESNYASLSCQMISDSQNFIISIEAESEEHPMLRNLLMRTSIHSLKMIAESTTDWDIEEVILEDDEWYNSL